MERSCQFYSKMPGFRIVYGGSSHDTFSTFELGREGEGRTYLNLELRTGMTDRRSATSSESEPDSDGEQNHDHNCDDGNLSKGAFLRTGTEQEEGKRGCMRGDFGRIIFHAEDVDGLYRYMKEDGYFSRHAIFETEPADAPWGERFFHQMAQGSPQALAVGGIAPEKHKYIE